MMLLAGVDIGGTKCAVSLGQDNGSTVAVMAQERFLTPQSPAATIDRIGWELELLLKAQHGSSPAAIGICCGGPLNSATGMILSPPNLPGWDCIDVCAPLRRRFNMPVGLQNDANACALAEWHWGAGRGCQTMIFLTFGTGMGAGLILDGRLFEGASGLAGEVGHIRLESDGPVGYRKAGSFEGFCSGGGIAHLARTMADADLRLGGSPAFCPTLEQLPTITALAVGEAAQQGDALAVQVWRKVGHYLGRGLAILVDVLNPERIVLGSIYGRQVGLLEPVVLEELRREALPEMLTALQILPAGLGEAVGDIASIAVARYALSGHAVQAAQI